MRATTIFLRLAVALALAPLAVAAGDSPEPAPLDCFLVITGGELLEGAYADGHTHFLTRTLRPLGVRCVGSMTVDDQRGEMVRALSFATNCAPLVLVTGGLGPTPNDITREVLSEFTGLPLAESEPVLAAMERRYGQPRDQLRANLRRQCLIPQPGGYLKNSSGSAVGLIFEAGGRTVIALPGPPRELQPMVREELVPWLERRFGGRRLGASLTLRFVGVGQSQITQTLQERVPLPAEVLVTSSFEGGRVDFMFTARSDSAADWAVLRQIETNLCQHLAQYFYADDGSSLEQVVLRALARRGVRLAVAEVASGGAVAASLNGWPDARGVVAGTFAAPTAPGLATLLAIATEPLQGADSTEAQVRSLAEAAAARARATWSLALGDGDGPGGAGSLWCVIQAGDRRISQRLTLRGTAAVDRASLVTPVLDRLRRVLEGLP